VLALPLRLPADSLTPGANRAQEARWPRGGEAARVDTDLGDDHLRGGAADPGDLIQPVGRHLKRGELGLDVDLQLGDVGAGLVDAAKHGGEQEAWWSPKRPQKASSSRPRSARRRVRASRARTSGSRSPAISAASIARPETPKMSEATTESLTWASSSS
jgi:hypothetical protein